MRKPPQRLCIYPKDVQRITGKSERWSRNLIRTIMLKLKKEHHQFITLEEFSTYTGIDLEKIRETIVD